MIAYGHLVSSFWPFPRLLAGLAAHCVQEREGCKGVHLWWRQRQCQAEGEWIEGSAALRASPISHTHPREPASRQTWGHVQCTELFYVSVYWLCYASVSLSSGRWEQFMLFKSFNCVFDQACYWSHVFAGMETFMCAYTARRFRFAWL